MIDNNDLPLEEMCNSMWITSPPDPNIHFAAYGLARPQSELQNPELRSRLPHMTPEELATFADTITAHNSNFESFGLRELEDVERFRGFDVGMFGLNTTSIGNLAHMALHSASVDVREKATACLDRLRDAHR